MISGIHGDEPIGALIARHRDASGKSQYTLAEALARASGNPAVTREYVNRWEHHKRIPTPYWRRHLSAVLDIPIDTLDRAAAIAKVYKTNPQPAPDPERALAPANGPATPMDPSMATMRIGASGRTLEEILDRWDELVRRRTFLARAGTVAATTLVPGVATASAPANGDVPEAIEACSQLTATYRRLDGVMGPAAVYTQAREHHGRLTDWLARTRDDGERQQVAALTADASILLAWLHFDLEQYAQAAGLYRRTADIADDLDDLDLRAFLVGRMSRTLSECGRHTEALTFADAAHHLADTNGTPAVRSWLAVTRAYVHACLGHAHQCHADLDTAAGLLDRVDEPPPAYIAFYGRPYLHKWSGHALLRIAEHETAALLKAQSTIDQAISAWSRADVRESGEVLTACASARLAQREVEEAAHLTARAWDIAAGTGSPRILRYVTELRLRMNPYRQTHAVRSLDEHLLTGR